MRSRRFLVTYFEAAKRMQPSDSSFYDPARLPKPASMSSATLCQFGKYLFLAQSSACRLGVIATITLDDTGLSQRAARLAAPRIPLAATRTVGPW